MYENTFLLTMWVSLSLIVSPIMLIHALGNIWGILGEQAWWWRRKGYKRDKACDMVFLIIPLLVGLHWLIVAIWFPNLYK